MTPQIRELPHDPRNVGVMAEQSRNIREGRIRMRKNAKGR
jgi:hypothetical protein